MLKFNKKTAGLSCHHEGVGRLTTGVAADRGIEIDRSLKGAQYVRLNGMMTAMQPLHSQALKDGEAMKQIPLIEINEVNTSYSWLLTGMSAHHEKPNDASGAMVMVLARQQTKYWRCSQMIRRLTLRQLS